MTRVRFERLSLLALALALGALLGAAAADAKPKAEAITCGSAEWKPFAEAVKKYESTIKDKSDEDEVLLAVFTKCEHKNYMGDGPLSIDRADVKKGKVKVEFQWAGPAGNSLIMTVKLAKAKADWVVKDVSSEPLH
jgi:hypothetical protein